MSSDSDLSALKELLRLSRCLHVANDATVQKYNALVEWATRTYWTVGVAPSEGGSVSVARYYAEPERREFEMAAGEYVFSLAFFGTAFIFTNGSLMEVGGRAAATNERVVAACRAVAAADGEGIEFILLTMFRDRWVIEDVVSRNQPPPALLDEARATDLAATPYVLVRLDASTVMTEEYARAVAAALPPPAGAPPATGLRFLRLGSETRGGIDFAKRTYVRVKSIELDPVGLNAFAPVLVTGAGERILARDVDHMARARARAGSFAHVARYPACTALLEVRADHAEPRTESLRRILAGVGKDFFVNGRYLSRAEGESVDRVRQKLRLDDLCASAADVVAAAPGVPAARKALRTQSLMDLARDTLAYPVAETLKLINNMSFQIENRRIVSFHLESADCLEDPTVEAVFCDFARFVAVFNLLTDAKEACEKAGDA
ncbi:DNA polymerase processivity factor [Squirrelpox virus]|uniref:DNA polymerase processivity factor n=1 Tax=Squirrelpox virus TaxID=240426 RepID=U3UBE0_9POXV|nr:DNA polymerase processivity factor [Squirrelpox virus]CCD83293.1 DNA polymerase processivity factor [Squirrelpox virus]